MHYEMKILLDLLEQSEWRTLADNNERQEMAFKQILQHAINTVPYYQKYLHLEKIPILSRGQYHRSGSAMISTSIPSKHGNTYPMETSGSTGENIEILATDFIRLFYDALLLREHKWRQRDFKKLLMAIRWARRDFGVAPQGEYQTTWGKPIDNYKETGPSVFLNISSANSDLIEAIQNYKPSYLQTYPSQLAALASFCLANDINLPFLQEARTTGETFTAKHREVIQEAWPQIKISDVYSSVEVGVIAQQCLEYDNYHVNMENSLLEIVDENDEPCAVGKAGRVLVTTLLNYATPLIRYEIGDYAEWGEPCLCGRGSAVIKKILGRTRNRLILPNGESRFPYLGERADVSDAIKAKVQKFQIVQQTVHDIEVKFVVSTALSNTEETSLLSMFKRNFVYPFNIYITYHDDIPLGPKGKYEEFVSKVCH